MKNSTFALMISIIFSHTTLSNAQITPNPEPSTTEKKCASEVNLIPNGNFMYGNDGSFQSGLPLKCNSCTSGSYCVGNQFKSKCSSWPATGLDHTLGTVSGSFLIVDGHPSKPAIVWSDSVCVCSGQIYTFSFWVKSLYPATQQKFDLEMLVDGISQKNISVSQQTPVWTKYELNWTSTSTKCIPIAIKQVSGGDYRDFGLDDIYFGFCCNCKPQEEVKPHCGKFAITLFNGVSPTQFSKIKITPNTGSKIINSSIGVYDEDGDSEWNQIIGSNYSYVEWSYKGTGIPFDNIDYLDEESYIWMDPTITTNQSIRIDWFDNSTTPIITATQNIVLPMSGTPSTIYSDQYDWEANTSTVTGANLNVFSGAAPETCDYDRLDAFGDCLNSITHSISCVNNKLILSFSCNPLEPGQSSLDWNYSVNGGSANLATNNMQLTQSGTYTLYLSIHYAPVYDGAGNDITPADCEYEVSFNVALPIPVISDIDVTPNTPSQQICNFQVKFDAQQSANISGLPSSAYSWQVTGPENKNQTGSSFSAVFSNQGNYTITLTITDAYGCTYTTTKTCTLSYQCVPKFTWGTYVWCKKNIVTPSPSDITIDFTNKSQGGKCPFPSPAYEINFGDGTGWQTFVGNITPKIMSHKFSQVPGAGANYTVKLRMKDSPQGGNCSSGKEYSEIIRIEPYYVDFSVLPCSDGKVFFSTTNDNPIWAFPGNANPINWIFQAALGNFGWYHNSDPEVRYEPSYNSATGTYSQYFAATLTATNNITHAQCSETKEFLVEQLCCDRKVKGHLKYYNTISGNKYRMWVHCKWKIKDRKQNLIFHTKIKVANRLSKAINKKKGKWYRRAFADEIWAGIEGTYWTKDNNGKCECFNPITQTYHGNSHTNFPRGKCVYRPNIKEVRNIREKKMEYVAGVKVKGTRWEIREFFRICH